MSSNYLESAIKQFQYYKMLGDRTFEQLNDDDIHWQFNDSGNSVSIIVKHMVGNMLSRWANFMSEDGEKSWRERDLEFVDSYISKSDMITAWDKSIQNQRSQTFTPTPGGCRSWSDWEWPVISWPISISK